MLNILSQPYPYPQQTILRRLLQCIGEGIFIAGFLIIFQPFGTETFLIHNKNLILLGYGLITAAAGTVTRLLLPAIFRNHYVEANWTIGREITTTILLLAIITIGNALYSAFTFKISLQISTFLWMFLNVILVGFFPIAFGVMLNYIYKLKKYSQPIIVTQSLTTNTPKPLQIIRLIAENEKDVLEIGSNDLFFIESSDNYSTVHFLKNDTLQKELLRSSLSRLETQIQNPNIVRCHRSYIVNMDRVARVSGNAQGYKFHLQPTELTVPVARKYSELVEKLR